MPVKIPSRKTHHVAHKKEKRTKHFLKVYAPYIPLTLIVTCGILVSFHSELHQSSGAVKGYATHLSDMGLLTETNKRRAEQGLSSLTTDSRLQAAAQAKAQDMADKNYWSHTTPAGQEPWTFIQAQHYEYRKAAENLAYGFTSNTTTLNGWMNSPGHRTNVLDKDVTQVGFGIVNTANFQGKGPETIVVALYAEPVSSGAIANQAVQSANTKPQTISFIQSVTAGKAPWSSFAIGLITGSALMYLLATHARSVRRQLINSERFVIHHPLFDTTLIALVVLAIIVSQTVGSIY